MNRPTIVNENQVEYSSPQKLTRLLLLGLFLTACPPREPNGIRSCRLDDATVAGEVGGYVRGTAADGAIICSPFARPAVPLHCPYVEEIDGFLYLHRFTAEQALTRRLPAGCPDPLAGLHRPCSTIVLYYRTQRVGDSAVDGYHVFTTDGGIAYTLHGPAQLVRQEITDIDAGCIGPVFALPEQNQGNVPVQPLNRSRSPSLLTGRGLTIDLEGPVHLHEAGVYMTPLPPECDSGYPVRSYYEDGACLPRWGRMCDAGTGIASHIAADGACLPNPGERCDAGRGAAGYVELDSACVRLDAGIDVVRE